jgi:hypothetical protein
MKWYLWWRWIIILFIITLSFGQDSAVINLIYPAQGSTTDDTRPTDNPFLSHTLDSSIPSPTNFIWSVHGNSRPLSYLLYLSEDTSFDIDDIAGQNITDTIVSVWNLKIATQYYWKIVGTDSFKNEWISPVFSFTTSGTLAVGATWTDS